jgi:hypothetical protein
MRAVSAWSLLYFVCNSNFAQAVVTSPVIVSKNEPRSIFCGLILAARFYFVLFSLHFDFPADNFADNFTNTGSYSTSNISAHSCTNASPNAVANVTAHSFAYPGPNSVANVTADTFTDCGTNFVTDPDPVVYANPSAFPSPFSCPDTCSLSCPNPNPYSGPLS